MGPEHQAEAQRPLTLAELMSRHHDAGRVEWIGLRPARTEPMIAVAAVDVTPSGLVGDRARKGPRALTLIQAEHLPVIASLSGHDAIAPATLRRNIVVSGINLSALKGRNLQLGSAVIQLSVICAPCSRMERALGHGGYNAMRGHGGWCAEIIEAGSVALGDGLFVV